MPCDYLSRSYFCSQDWCPTHSTASHSPSYPEFNCNNFFQLLSVFPKFIFTSIACIKSHGTHLQQYCGHHQFSSSIIKQASKKLQRPLLLALPLIALIRPRWQPWQVMKLDIATLSVLGTLVIGAT
jgi:hypothetical protein